MSLLGIKGFVHSFTTHIYRFSILSTFFKEKGVVRNSKQRSHLRFLSFLFVFFFFCFFAIFALFFFSFFKLNRCFFENGEEFRHDAVLNGHTLVKMLEESPFSLIKKVERVCDNKCVTRCVTGVTQRTCGKLRKQKDLLKKLLIAILLCCRLKLQF